MVAIIKGNAKDYAVEGQPALKGFNSTCCPFVEVMHVTHTFRLPEILRSKALAARLVYDNSTLNDSRIHVVWVSPNTWSRGSRYGTVSLGFDWKSLLAGRKPYWVEVAKYGVHACRILLTTHDYPSLTPYDPTVRNGPWWYDASTDKHYYNSTYCLELMVEGDVDLARISETGFVTHHEEWCNEYRTEPSRCAEKGDLAQFAAARAIAFLLGSGLDPGPLKIADVRPAWWILRSDLDFDSASGTAKADDSVSAPLAASVLHAYAARQEGEADALIGLFATSVDARSAVRGVIERAFGLGDGELDRK